MFSINTKISQNDESNKIKQLHLLMSQLELLKNKDDSCCICRCGTHLDECELCITISMDSFKYKGVDKLIYKLSTRHSYTTDYKAKAFHFSKDDISELAIIAMSLYEHMPNNQIVDDSNMWLFNKHTAVSREIKDVANGSRRIYSMSAVQDICGMEQFEEWDTTPKYVHNRLMSAQSYFEKIQSETSTTNIPQHHLFYMIFEDMLYEDGEEVEYTEDRYNKDFKIMLTSYDQRHLSKINNSWSAFWNNEFTGHPVENK